MLRASPRLILLIALAALTGTAFSQTKLPFTGTRTFCAGGSVTGPQAIVTIHEDGAASAKVRWAPTGNYSSFSGKLSPKWTLKSGDSTLEIKTGTNVIMHGAQDSFPATLCKQAPETTAATAAEVAAQARGKVECPAKIATAPRNRNAPVDDVLGVRPGMTYEEAAAVVLCTHERIVVQPATSRGVDLKTYGHKVRQGFNARFAEPKKTSQQHMQEMRDRQLARSTNRIVQDLKPGQVKWFVGTMGVPGSERVINVAREEWFEEGQNPTMADLEQALRKKYGTPSKTQPGGGRHLQTWIYDPQGRRVTEGSLLYTDCQGTYAPDGGAHFSPDCGIVVAAVIYPMRNNPALTQYMQVGVVSQAGGYQAIVATEKALQQADAQRRATEVGNASKNTKAPKL